MAIRASKETEPRNKDIENNEDFEDKVIAKKMQEDHKRYLKIDELASLADKPEPKEEEPSEEKKIADFIEIIIKIGK